MTIKVGDIITLDDETELEGNFELVSMAQGDYWYNDKDIKSKVFLTINQRHCTVANDTFNYCFRSGARFRVIGLKGKSITDVRSTKIYVHNPEISEIVQEKLFALGCRWTCGCMNAQYTEYPALYIHSDNRITYASEDAVHKTHFKKHPNKEITLRDLFQDVDVPKSASEVGDVITLEKDTALKGKFKLLSMMDTDPDIKELGTFKGIVYTEIKHGGFACTEFENYCFMYGSTFEIIELEDN